MRILPISALAPTASVVAPRPRALSQAGLRAASIPSEPLARQPDLFSSAVGPAASFPLSLVGTQPTVRRNDARPVPSLTRAQQLQRVPAMPADLDPTSAMGNAAMRPRTPASVMAAVNVLPHLSGLGLHFSQQSSGGALLGLLTALLGGNLGALAASNVSHAMAQAQREIVANLR